MSSRPSHLALRATLGCGNLAAGAAVAAVVAQLLVAQLTLGLLVAFVVIGRTSRWRPLWLAWPAAAGACWVLAIGPRPAMAGFLAAGGHLIGFLTRPGRVWPRLAHLPAVLASWRHWLPAQLPMALIAAAAQASIVAAAGPGGGQRYRAGALVAARRAYVTASLRRGELATGVGGCLGVVVGTGARAAISWREAEAGVLITGQDAAAVTSTGLDLAIAAIQHRKTVIIMDLGEPAGRGDAAHDGVTAPIAAACADLRAPLLNSGDSRSRYEPLSCLPPDRAADLVMAMIDWSGAAQARHSLCADYLRIALAVSAAGAAAGAAPRSGVLDELAGLLRPGALLLRLGQMPGTMPAGSALHARAAELTRQHEADPGAAAAVAAVAAQLAALRGSPAGTPMCRPTAAADREISLRRALTEREVVLFALGRRTQERPATMVARLAVADLSSILAERGDLGTPADCLVWINGCDAVDQAPLAALLALGPAAGTAVLLGTAAAAAAVGLADRVSVLAVRGRAPHGLTAPRAAPASPPGSPVGVSLKPEDSIGLPAAMLAGRDRDALSLRVRGPLPRLLTGCRAAR